MHLLLMFLLPPLLRSFIILGRGAWEIYRLLDDLHGKIFFNYKDLGSFLVVMAMSMKRMVNGQNGRSKVRKQIANGPSTHG